MHFGNINSYPALSLKIPAIYPLKIQSYLFRLKKKNGYGGRLPWAVCMEASGPELTGCGGWTAVSRRPAARQTHRILYLQVMDRFIYRQIDNKLTCRLIDTCTDRRTDRTTRKLAKRLQQIICVTPGIRYN